MKILFPAHLIRAVDISRKMCSAVAERKSGEIKTLLGDAYDTRTVGLTELSRQFVTPIDREDIASLYTMAYRLSESLADADAAIEKSGRHLRYASLLAVTVGNCEKALRIFKENKLPPPDVLLEDHLRQDEASTFFPFSSGNTGLSPLLFYTKRCEDISFRMLDYILRSSIKNN